MARIALVVHHDRPEAGEVAVDLANWLAGLGHTVCLPEVDAERVGRADLGVAERDLSTGLDVAVSLGGDGTMLRTVALVAEADVPVMGVNFGQLGYLTDVEPDGARFALERFLDGEHTVEERMLLAIDVTSSSVADGDGHVVAFNEAVLEKTASGHTVRLDVDLDGTRFTPYAADGLIVATPTGSTAYAFSARGPIVEPGLRAIALTPVSPHMLFDRTMVLKPTTTVRLDVIGPRPATLSVDGRNLGPLVEGDGVVCTAAAQPARLVTFERRDFHRILKSKFGLNDR